MYYSDLVKKAAQISFEAHKHDKDKSGYPYFMHPMTLAVQFDDEASVCVALLHDVIEDHGDKYSFEYLKEQGFAEDILEPLRLLTHQDGIDYLDYVKEIKKNPITRKVKLADLHHNTDLTRCGGVKPPKYGLYLKAIEILESKERDLENEYNWTRIIEGASKYDAIMKRFAKVDVSKDESFQRTFTGFYKVRRSKDAFLKKYYSFMEESKGKELSFETVIKKLETFEGRVEASFSSKLLATINPKMPIWDQYVLANTGIVEVKYYQRTIRECISKYAQLCRHYEKFLKTGEAKEMIASFDEKLPQYRYFADIKKIDLMFWQKR